jgi:hypothetical protein
MVSTSSNSTVGSPSAESTSRYRAFADADTVVTGRGVRSSTISSARDLPDPGSGERNAIRGVVSKQSMRWACASHRVTAT